MSTPITIIPNGTYTISNSYFNGVDTNKVIKTAKLYVRIPALLFPNYNKIILYHVNQSNVYEQVDASTQSTIMGGVYLTFDISIALFNYLQLSGSFVLKNESNNDITIYMEDISVEVDYYNEYNTDSRNVLSLDIPDYSLSFNHLTQTLLIKRDFYSGLLPYDFSIIYSSRLKDESIHFLPKGWKLSFLDYLIIVRDNNNSITSITLIDKNNCSHELVKLTGLSNTYYTNDGSALLLKVKNDGTFELFNELSSAKKIFNSDGYLISYTNEDSRTITVNYNVSNQISITDYNSNIIIISYDSSLDKINVSLNNGLVYSLFLTNNHLISISYDTYSESLLYSGDSLASVTSYDSHSVNISYSSNRISSISKYFNLNKIEEYIFEYQYLKTIIVNIMGVETFLSYDFNFDIVQTGEVTDDVEEIAIYTTKHLISGDYYIPNKDNQVGRTILSNSGYTLNSSSNAAETKIYSTYPALSTSWMMVADKKYVLLATLSKPSNVSFGASRNVKITIGYHQNSTPHDIKTYEFSSNVVSQKIALAFQAPISESIEAPQGLFYYVRLESQNFGDFGGVTFSDISIIETDVKIISYYAIKESTINNDMVIEGTPETIDNHTWHEISEDIDVENDGDYRYSYRDLIRNYLNLERETFYIWSDDLHTLRHCQSTGGYFFRQHRNLSGCNTIFAKKVLKKIFADNNIVKTIYTFSYIQKDLNMDDEPIYRLINIKQIGDDTYRDASTYDEDFRLVKENKSNNDITEYFYGSNNNLIKVETRNTQSTGRFRQSYSYDLKDRLISDSGLSSTNIETRQTSYIGSLELISSVIDESNNSKTFTYDTYYRYVTKVEKGASENNSLYIDSTNSQLSNDSVFKFEKSDYDELYKFKVKTGTNTYSDVVTIEKEFDNLGYPITVTRDNLIYTYDKYNRLTHILEPRYIPQIQTTLNVQVYDFYYFDSRPIDLEDDETTAFPDNKSTSKAKLYRIDDNDKYKQTYFNYDNGDRIVEIKNKLILGNNNYEIDTYEYEYDHQGRLKKSTYTFSDSSSYYITLTYKNSNSDLVTTVSYSNNITEQNTFDALSRKSTTSVQIGINSPISGSYGKMEYVYYYKNISDNNSTIKLESPLIKQVNYYLRTIDPIHPNYIVIAYDYSAHLTYDSKGNISSIKKGDIVGPTSSTGVEYLYDVNNRLIQEDSYDLNKTIKYSYDNNGNITSVQNCRLKTNRVISSTSFSYDTYYKDLLVSVGLDSITYDSHLNPISYGHYSYSWLYNKYLSSITNQHSNLDVSFEYNHNGIRTKKTQTISSLSSTYYIYHDYYLEGNKIIREKVTNTQNSSSYILDFYYGANGIIGFKKGNNYYRYEKNIFGDIIAIYNVMTLEAKYVYDAFGNVKVFDINNNEITYSSNPTHIGIINPFRYRGYYFDSETNLYYCNARYYVPEWRRWLSIDDVSYIDPNSIDGLNLYAYCLNNPVMHMDPEGEFPFFTYFGYILGLLSYKLFGQVGVSALTYFGACIDSLYDEDVRKGMDAIGWNPLNSNDQLSFNSIKNGALISFYKGVPIFQTKNNFNRSGSFGAIFVHKNENDNNTIKHEYGHIIQMQILGIERYLLFVFAPSALQLGVIGDNYYLKVWELSANIIGGIIPNNTTLLDIGVSFAYIYLASCFPSIYLYLFSIFGWNF